MSKREKFKDSMALGLKADRTGKPDVAALLVIAAMLCGDNKAARLVGRTIASAKRTGQLETPDV